MSRHNESSAGAVDVTMSMNTAVRAADNLTDFRIIRLRAIYLERVVVDVPTKLHGVALQKLQSSLPSVEM